MSLSLSPHTKSFIIPTSYQFKIFQLALDHSPCDGPQHLAQLLLDPSLFFIVLLLLVFFIPLTQGYAALVPSQAVLGAAEEVGLTEWGDDQRVSLPRGACRVLSSHCRWKVKDQEAHLGPVSA